VSVELVPLATMVAELAAPFMLAETPVGNRIIFEVVSGTVEGERINAKMKGNAAADWLAVGPDNTGTIDVRVLMETDDGALVFIQYQGRVDSNSPSGPIYIAPKFETGDDRYRWLNRVQAVGKGFFDGTTITYELYEVR
jgi:hypothetical protein